MLIIEEFTLVIRSAGSRPAFIEFVAFSDYAVDFLIYPEESILSA